MKIKAIILAVIILFSYACIRMKPRDEKIKLPDGEVFEVKIYTEYNPVDFVWVMSIYTEKSSLLGLACGDKPLIKTANEIWSEIEKNDDVTKIDVASVSIKNSENHYCSYLYSQRENGEWR